MSCPAAVAHSTGKTGFCILPWRFVIAVFLFISFAKNAAASNAELLSCEGAAKISLQAGAWLPADVGQNMAVKDRLRTEECSRAAVRLTNQSVLRLDELTTIEILAEPDATVKSSLSLQKGAAYFFSRDRPREIQLRTPVATGALRGTEFHLRVAGNGRTELTMLDGEVELRNALGVVYVTSGEQGIVEPGQAPRKTAVIYANNIIQWALYYPGVINLDELSFTDSQRQRLAPVLEMWQAGNLTGALHSYHPPAGGVTGDERLFHAALLLAAGQVDRSEALMGKSSSAASRALHSVIAAVRDPISNVPNLALESTSTEWLAQSYLYQSAGRLVEARKAARQAVKRSPSFGFGWARLAEMEFAFGETKAARKALQRSLEISPENAQALALQGFVQSAAGRFEKAESSFERAITLDAGLGNGWLGRGLCRIHRGEKIIGRQDLVMAALAEPQRAFFRSYLGKAYGNEDDFQRAHRELGLARHLDPNDPTGWLYSALLNRQENRPNTAVHDIEESLRLNDNRRIYRSSFLLDQDRAVRRTNLASIYRDEGLIDFSVQEAARAVEDDYANHSAHLFLSDSFDALRDPTRIILRYETAWFNELLLANLLAPVGSGVFSQNVSLQEYSRLFEGDHNGLSSSTEYFSDGRFRERATVSATFGNTAVSLDTDYYFDNGRRPNNQTSREETFLNVRQQLTESDSVYLQLKHMDYNIGDVFQYEDPSVASRHFDVTEKQEPLILLGGRHDWSPQQHTLYLAGRLTDEQATSDLAISRRIDLGRPGAPVTSLGQREFDIFLESQYEVYTFDLQHIAQFGHQTFLIGGRYQDGSIETTNDMFLANTNPFLESFLLPLGLHQDFSSKFERYTGYAYAYLQPFHRLQLVLGLTYDTLTHPEDYRNPPLARDSIRTEKWSPKIGFTYNPFGRFYLRGVYAKALGGVSLDESFRLEPTQVAGFNQAYRTIISESIAGSVEAPQYETIGAGLDWAFGAGSYLGVEVQQLKSVVDRQAGIFHEPPLIPQLTLEELRYKEENLLVSASQLVGDYLSIGGRFRVTRATLNQREPALLNVLRTREATLHQLDLFAIANHPTGWFSRVDAIWTSQDLEDGAVDRQGDDFWQFNVLVGRRFLNRRIEVAAGILNITDQAWHLDPLTIYEELPQDRTAMLRVKLDF